MVLKRFRKPFSPDSGFDVRSEFYICLHDEANCMKEIDFSDGIEVQKCFDEIVRSLQSVKIVSVFTASPSFSNYGDVRKYMEDTEIYILFENWESLAIDYRFIDALSISLRPLTEEEKSWYKDALIKDLFNDSTDIYTMQPDNRHILNRTQKIFLEYDSLKRIGLDYVTRAYSKWIGGTLVDEVMPKPTTFDRITFTMENGNSFVICPAAADNDGYTFVWSKDAQ